MQTMLIVVVVLNLVLTMCLARRLRTLRHDLTTDYWTKDVVGRTIKAKTGDDPSRVDPHPGRRPRGHIETPKTLCARNGSTREPSPEEK